MPAVRVLGACTEIDRFCEAKGPTGPLLNVVWADTESGVEGSGAVGVPMMFRLPPVEVNVRPGKFGVPLIRVRLVPEVEGRPSPRPLEGFKGKPAVTGRIRLAGKPSYNVIWVGKLARLAGCVINMATFREVAGPAVGVN